MSNRIWLAFGVVLALATAAPATAAIKRVPYPKVAVELPPAFKPEADFERFRSAFRDAVAKKNAEALFALVAPGFVWTHNGELIGAYDPSRDAQHNFRVVFGFRPPGKDADGPVEDGPFWSLLSGFADETSYYQAVDTGGLVCSPTAVTVTADEVLDRARARIESEEDTAEWYFVLRSTPVAKAPDDKGPPVGTLNAEAFPVLSARPEAADATPTHYEVLLPSGKAGWIPAASARPIQTNRLCYALTAQGEWKIGMYDDWAEDE
jgi:hypothetical protein